MPAVDYPYIRAWGHLMGSGTHYIEDEVRRAKLDQAPQDVIYWRSEQQHAAGAPHDNPEHLHRANGRVWYRYGGVTNAQSRAIVDQWITRYGQG